jgi:hypothetical protein
VSEEPASKAFVDREISHLKELIKEQFEGRDRAITLLASKVPLIISIAGLLLGVLAAALAFVKH